MAGEGRADMVTTPFQDFMSALLDGEPQALADLDRLYSPYLCQLIRPWLAEAGLQHVADASDVCQTVLWKWLICLRAGRYQALQMHEHLQKVLYRMARNEVHDLGRRERHARRDQPAAAIRPLGGEEQGLADSASSPSQHVAREELERQFLGRLSKETRHIHARRAQGWTWPQIAAEVGGFPNTVRVRFDREIERVVRTMGLHSD
jgi:DNA-directed RNA polymerase specialized sigma24 family protein